MSDKTDILHYALSDSSWLYEGEEPYDDMQSHDGEDDDPRAISVGFLEFLIDANEALQDTPALNKNHDSLDVFENGLYGLPDLKRGH